MLRAALKYQDRGWFGTWELLYVDDFFVDNANSTKNDAYWVSNLRSGYARNAEKREGTLYLGVNNLWDEDYVSNVCINAFGGRYFEPAPERNLYAGISLR